MATINSNDIENRLNMNPLFDFTCSFVCLISANSINLKNFVSQLIAQLVLNQASI